MEPDFQNAGFKGFTANIFGRIAELAQQYLKLRGSIQAFFDAVIDINSNGLVFAISMFIQNDWFACCSEVYTCGPVRAAYRDIGFYLGTHVVSAGRKLRVRYLL